MIDEVANSVAKKLLEIQAIKLNVEQPYTWASGWRSPIYCDNRLALSYPDVRSYIKEQLSAGILENYPQVEAIAGVATAGIPQGALVADSLDLPFLYVRSKAKGHGMENLIEGKVVPGQKVVVVEDLISTGGSSLKAVDALIHQGFEVLGMAAIFTYGFPVAEKSFLEKGIDFFSLSNYQVLIEEALKGNYIGLAQVEKLKLWRENPSEWS